MACVRLEYESKIIKSSPQASFLKLTMLFSFEKIKKKKLKVVPQRLIYASNLGLFVPYT